MRDTKEKNECVAKLQRKWRSLRDSYNRDIKKSSTSKCGLGASKQRQYLYFKNLYFLKPLAERRTTENSIHESQQNEDGESIIQDSTDESRKATKRKMPKNTDQESELIKKLSSSLSNRLSKDDHPVNPTDSDLHFLLSLYDRFKAIDNHLKLQAQIEILNVIQEYSRLSSAYL